jgi:hypothetical protein
MKHLLLPIISINKSPGVTPGLNNSSTKRRCFIYWDHEWHQVLYSLWLWVRTGALFIETTSGTRCFIDWDHEWEQVLHLLRPRVTPGALLIEIMSKSRCFIYWDYEWHQVLYWLRLWVRAALIISINKAPGVTRGLNKSSTCSYS